MIRSRNWLQNTIAAWRALKGSQPRVNRPLDYLSDPTECRYSPTQGLGHANMDLDDSGAPERDVEP